MKYIHRTLDILAGFTIGVVVIPIGSIAWMFLSVLYILFAPSVYYVLTGNKLDHYESVWIDNKIDMMLISVCSFPTWIIDNIGPSYYKNK
jgi:hypothetical protein